MLTTINPSHSHILEGCLCAFLDHLGSSLSLAVLTNPSLCRSSKPSTASYRPKVCRKYRPWTQTAMRTVQLEAPYLIHILDNVMTFINTHQTLIGFRSASSPSSSSKDGSNSNSSCSNAFAKQVKEKLQNALLKGVFGGDNETFCDCLQLPLYLRMALVKLHHHRSILQN
jgi:hypothetical protein